MSVFPPEDYGAGCHCTVVDNIEKPKDTARVYFRLAKRWAKVPFHGGYVVCHMPSSYVVVELPALSTLVIVVRGV